MEETKRLIDLFVAEKLERIAFAQRELFNSAIYTHWNGIIEQNIEFIENLNELKNSIE